MTTPDALRRALDVGDDQTARRAIFACGESLRDGRVESPGALVELLVPLASHASVTVRQAVADACDSFPDGAFDEVHAILLADRDPFVRDAAKAAGHRHAKRLRRATKQKEEETLVSEALREIEDRFRPEARRLAKRAVDCGVEQFGAQVAHEVGKAEASVRRALDELEAEVDRPECNRTLLKGRLAAVRERSLFAFAMVRRARDYSERVKPIFKAEPLAEIVREARAQLVDRLGPRAAKLALTIDVDPALRLTADRYLLLQALQNVLQNAAEAYPEGAERLTVRVAASARHGGSEVVLTVADDGAGIPEDRRASLFVPFKSRKPGGTGLGLLIMRRAIEEAHGGRLTLDGAPGKGTTVTMVLPAKQGGA